MVNHPEIDPAHIETLHSMMGARGWISNSYAQVEFLLADLVRKASALEPYLAWRDRPLAFGVDGRVARVLEMATEEPLLPFRAILQGITDQLLRMEEPRHFYTHGFAAYHFTPEGDQALQFRRYVPPAKGGVANLAVMWRRPAEMEQERQAATAFAEFSVQAFREIYLALGLEPDADAGRAE